jgi:hypothetical protein
MAIPAGVIGILPETAFITFKNMSPHNRGSAMGYMKHDLVIFPGDIVVISVFFTMGSEDIRKFHGHMFI